MRAFADQAKENAAPSFVGLVFYIFSRHQFRFVLPVLYPQFLRQPVGRGHQSVAGHRHPLWRLFVTRTDTPRPRWPPHATFQYAFVLDHAARIWVLKNEIIYYLIIFALLIYGIVGLSCAVFAAHRYDLKLKDWSSYTEGVDLRWLGKTVWAFLGIFAVWIIASFLNQEWVVVPYNFSICAFFTVIAYCLSRQQVVDFSKENPFDGADGQDTALADGLDNAPDAEEADEEVVPFKQALQERMVQAFETERVFLDKKLTIVRLAEIVGTNRTYLSNFINAELQSSFSDYVNGYRVSFAKTLLVENNAPLDVIAEMSGFNSVSSFRRMFSAVEGCTPGQYRRKACSEKADGDIQPSEVK